ncbi:MAG TPA: MarR family winged helix-turn-helix transcriptional regulator [Steroidobacteraceae bacterium]
MYMHHVPTSPICACTTLRKASRALSRIYDEALLPAGMTVAQLAVLRAIGRGEGGEPLSRLAESLVMDRTSLYRALAPLKKSGWVAINAGPRGRAKQVELTVKGERAVQAARKFWDAAQTTILGEFGAERWTFLQHAVAELTALGVKLGGAALQRA